MKVVRTDTSPTKVKLTITAGSEELEPIKNHTLQHFAGSVKVPGFREGAAPSSMVEKHVDQKMLVDEFMEHALNSLYSRAVVDQGLKPIANPKVEIKKLVPFTTLEFDIEVDVLGPVKLPDYKKIKLSKESAKVTAKEVDDVVKSLQKQQASRKEASRPAKNGDEVTIDFKGVDEKGAAVGGAEGKDYPLELGSNSFIPGFEKNLVGVKAGDEKTFTLTFPKDYGVTALQNQKVTFTVQVKKIQELSEPPADDAFAKKAGPFKAIGELKADIKKELLAQKERDSQINYQNELVNKITEKAQLQIPEALVEEQILRAEEEEKRNLVYRGQTWQQHLEEEGVSEQQHRERQRPAAVRAVKSSLVLAEISEREKIEVSPEEIEIRIKLLKGQYTDPQMQAELDKPEARRDISGRLRLEKTLDKLVSYASK